MTKLRRLLTILSLNAILGLGGLAILPVQPVHAQLLGKQSVAAGKSNICIDGGRIDPANVAPCLDPATPASEGQPWIFTVWKWSLGIINIFAVIVLIIMAFANIIYPWKFLEPYRIRQLLPSFIWGIILANASLFICRAVVSVGDLLLGSTGVQVTLNELFTHWGISAQQLTAGVIPAKFGILTFPSGDISNLGKLVYELLISTALVYLPIIALLALTAIFYLRFAVIFVLTAFSPLAFGSIIFPATSKFLSTWWDTFWKWTFGGVASYFLLYAAAQVAATSKVLSSATYVDIIPYGISLFLVYMAIQAPFKLGGAIAAGYKRAVGWVGRSGQKMARGVAKDWEQTKSDSHVQRMYGALGRNMKALYEKGSGRLTAEQDNFNAGGKRNYYEQAIGRFQKTLGGAYNKTNFYGRDEAKKRAREYQNSTYAYAARTKSGIYAAHLGEEAGLKFHEADNSQRIGGMTLEAAQTRIDNMNAAARARGGATWESLTEDERDQFVNGSYEKGVSIGHKLGLHGAEDIDTYKLLRRRETSILSSEQRQRELYQGLGIGGPGGGGAGGGPHGVPAAPPAGPRPPRPSPPPANGPGGGAHGVPSTVAPNLQVVGQAAPATGLGAAASTAAVANELKHEGQRTPFTGGEQPAAVAATHTTTPTPAAQASTASVVHAMNAPLSMSVRPAAAGVDTGIGRASAAGVGSSPLGVRQLGGQQPPPRKASIVIGKPGRVPVGAAPITMGERRPSSGGQIFTSGPAIVDTDAIMARPLQAFANNVSTDSLQHQAQQQIVPQIQNAPAASRPVNQQVQAAQPAVAIPAPTGAVATARPIIGSANQSITPSSPVASVEWQQTVRQEAAAAQQQQAQAHILDAAGAATSKVAGTRVGQAATAIRSVVVRGQAVKEIAGQHAATAVHTVATAGQTVTRGTINRATSAIKTITQKAAQTSLGKEAAAAGTLIRDSQAAKQTRQMNAADMAAIQQDLKAAARVNPADTHGHLAQQYQANIQNLSQQHASVSNRLADVTQKVNRQLELAGYAGAKPHQTGFDQADVDLRREMLGLTQQQQALQEDIMTQQRRLAKLQGRAA